MSDKKVKDISKQDVSNVISKDDSGIKKQDQYPSEIIDLPSGGKLYPEGHPLSGGKIEVKYMTAREEDILTSQNLIRKGVVLDRLLDSLILTKGISVQDLYVGDKNAIMVAARILAYGSSYTAEIEDPDSGEKITHNFDLSDLDYKKLPDDIEYTNANRFVFTLPVSKKDVTIKLLNGRDEEKIDQELTSLSKISGKISREVTTRLKHAVVSVDGETDGQKISDFVENMLARDSLFLRNKISEIMPDIVLEQSIETGEGEVVKVDIPMTTNFFWPQS